MRNRKKKGKRREKKQDSIINQSFQFPENL